MSLPHFSKALYQDLPSQNLGFVEGGVLICPSMLGLTLPTDMQERDLYIYLCLYNQVMKKLSLAQNESQGKDVVRIASKELNVSKENFEKDTGKIYMLECLIANKVLPTNFNQIQTVFKTQQKRSEDLQKDLENSVDETAKSIGEKLRDKVALTVQNVNKEKEIEVAIRPPKTSSSQSPLSQNQYAGSNALALGSPANPNDLPNEIVPNTEDENFLNSALSFASKPPVLIGGVVGAYFLLNKYVFTKDTTPKKVRKNRKSKKKRYRS